MFWRLTRGAATIRIRRIFLVTGSWRRDPADLHSHAAGRAKRLRPRHGARCLTLRFWETNTIAGVGSSAESLFFYRRPIRSIRKVPLLEFLAKNKPSFKFECRNYFATFDCHRSYLLTIRSHFETNRLRCGVEKPRPWSVPRSITFNTRTPGPLAKPISWVGNQKSCPIWPAKRFAYHRGSTIRDRISAPLPPRPFGGAIHPCKREWKGQTAPAKTGVAAASKFSSRIVVSGQRGHRRSADEFGLAHCVGRTAAVLFAKSCRWGRGNARQFWRIRSFIVARQRHPPAGLRAGARLHFYFSGPTGSGNLGAVEPERARFIRARNESSKSGTSISCATHSNHALMRIGIRT